MKNETKATYQRGVDEIKAAKGGIVIYDLPEICGILDISRATAMRYIKKGILPCVKIGGRWTIEKGKLEAFIQGTAQGK